VAAEVAAMDAAVAEIERQMATGREIGRQVAEGQKAAADKAAAEERERRAVETFPGRSKEIGSMLASAATNAAQTKWQEADAELTRTQKALDEFAGTSVEKSKEWTGLAAKLADQRKRIEPQLDRIKEKRQAAAAKEQAEAEARGPEPLQSGWDGEVTAVHNYLKEALKDPDSYQHDKCTKLRAEGAFWVVECSYRAKNSFGALTKDGLVGGAASGRRCAQAGPRALSSTPVPRSSTARTTASRGVPHCQRTNPALL
jgi:hypothetical protein